MPRRWKPDDQISKTSVWRRKVYEKNPERRIKDITYAREYYKKNKAKLTIGKKLQKKRLRETHINLLGGKCFSCGEPYNPHRRISNLDIDHKFYISSKNLAKTVTYQIQDQIDQGLDPNRQFMLLCKTCHMILTYLRKDMEKSKHLVALAIKLDILRPPS
jgi:5-methylcytosine-specific restriction endonuclease McrA